MAIAANLGFPRIGDKRQLKKAVEAYWKGNLSETELQEEAKNLRKVHWEMQKNAGIEHIPSNDFSFYDQVLDNIALFGCVPSRYNFSGDNVDLTTYFAMARGRQADGQDVVAMEMTKWFDTNYHYIVPEFDADTKFKLSSNKPIDEYNEAKALGIETRPVILGPVTFFNIGKIRDENVNTDSLFANLLEAYSELFVKLEATGVEWIQLDEPALVLDLDEETKIKYKQELTKLIEGTSIKIILATYFGDLRDNLDLAAQLPTEGLHIDLRRAPEQLDDVLNAIPEGKILSLGLIDGRNIWKTDLTKALSTAKKAVNKVGADNIQIAGSCSLLHSPVDLDSEGKLDDELKSWLSFAKQKLSEISLIASAVNGNKDETAFAKNAADVAARNSSTRIHNQAVKTRFEAITEADLNRNSPFDQRIKTQRTELNLPLLPTTTIGSFPQTQEVRQARAKFKKGELSRSEYDAFLEAETERTIRIQEDLDIDVLVHGEFERNDMVEYFGEKLDGFAFSQFGWVQSYGSRCVKPPIIFGDISRPKAMTVRWAEFSQSKTDRVMKGMLTGPVTILQWSFVRDDQPREVTCKQISLAIRDEVVDLEKAGIKIIQIDEAALREGLPLRKSDHAAYLRWAVDSFRISAGGVEDKTQIHTHMCYSEFNDIIESVARMDADAISIETSRSAMELLDAFVAFKYPNEIGPGVYDIHSPRVPKQTEMETLLRKALDVLTPEQVWVNPDCGLKTRGWPEVKDALKGMVSATKTIRSEISNGGLKKAS